jgi:hypothetical protein
LLSETQETIFETPYPVRKALFCCPYTTYTTAAYTVTAAFLKAEYSVV